MSTDDTYNGYTNRETWAFNLHWQNDQGLYNDVLDHAREYLTETYGDEWATLPADEMRGAEYGVGESVVTYLRDQLWEYAENAEGPDLARGVLLIMSDIGSFWRINHAEVGAAVRESLENEA